MINKPTCSQLVAIVREELRTTVSGAVTDPQAAGVLSMIDQILQNVENRCDHEIAWMREEIDRIQELAHTLIGAGDDTEGHIALALAQLTSGPGGLHIDDVGASYSLAGEVLSRCIEAAVGGPSESLVEEMMLERLEREVLIRGDFQLAARG